MEAGGESQGDGPEFVDPFDTGRDGESDAGEVEAAVEPPAAASADPEPQAAEGTDAATGEELPPDPGLLVTRNAYGPGAHSVKFADGTPLGVFVSEQGMTGDQVRELLAGKLDDDLIDFYARNRDKAIAATGQLAADPVVAAFAEEEDRGRAAKQERQQAFLAEYRKKQKEKT